MKILHTSDWHIGQKLHGHDREEEHLLFFEFLKKLILSENIEVLIVAGDIFDVGFPSNSALKIYYNFLTQIQQTNCKNIIITGGNHDSVSTLNAPKDILEFLNVKVIGGVSDNLEDEIIEIKNAEDKTELIVAAVPFLRDRNIRKSEAGETYENRIKAIKAGIIKHYKDIAKKISDQNVVKIACGHLFLIGSKIEKSDSERDIHIGNSVSISANDLPNDFHYYALGHLHRPQKISKNENIRYSGSPIPLSFSERKDNKNVVIISTENNKISNVKTYAIPQFKKLIKIEGNFEYVINKLSEYKSESILKPDLAEVLIKEEFDNFTTD